MTILCLFVLLDRTVCHLTILDQMSLPKRLLVLSLGNPPAYDGTRHSVGHLMLKLVCTRLGAQPNRTGSFNTHETEIDDTRVTFYRVPGYMNESGKSLNPFYKIWKSRTKKEIEDTVIILHDELDVDVGKIKVRSPGRSHRGHNGLRSIQASSPIGKDYVSFQIGIGRNYSGDRQTPGVVANYVLSKFTPKERLTIESETLDKVVDAIKTYV